MALTENQAIIARCIFNAVNNINGVTPMPRKTTAGAVMEYLRSQGITLEGRKVLDAFLTDTKRPYPMDFSGATEYDSFIARLEAFTESMPAEPTPKVARKPRTPQLPRAPRVPTAEPATTVTPTTTDAPWGFYIPSRDERFMPFGAAKTLEKIVRSRAFLPTYIFGDTGIAKSLSVVQACAKNKRELIRLNVNAHTCEEDFVGGFRLVDGETVFQAGPLVLAMKRGAILLVDEISAMNPANAFCLFSVLDSGELYIKKTNEKVVAADGFNIIVTDNTRGKGSSTGRFVGTSVQNDAMLDRFLVTLQYDYPTPVQELKILNLVADNPELNENLIKWANIVRESFRSGIIDENVSVRKLVSILKINEVFNDIRTSIGLALARYEEETKAAMLDLFDKVVADPLYGAVNFDDVSDVEVEEPAAV